MIESRGLAEDSAAVPPKESRSDLGEPQREAVAERGHGIGCASVQCCDLGVPFCAVCRSSRRANR